MSVLDLHLESAQIASTLDVVVPEPLRDRTVLTWLGRMVNEHGSARVFEGLAAQIERASLGADLHDECLAFAEEERRHGIMCGAVVVAAGGRAVADVPAADAFPDHEDTTPLCALARNVVSIACMAETVAVALIGQERDDMAPGTLHTLLTRIWADEVGHARFGWRLLPTILERMSTEERADLEAYLPVAFERHELAHLPLGAVLCEGGAALGLCSGREARGLFYDTVAQAIVPGLDRLGLRAGDAWEKRHERRVAA